MQQDLPQQLRLAQDLLQRGDSISAATVLRKLIATYPQSSQAHEMLGVISLMGGARQQGLELLRQAAALGPITLENRYRLGQSLLERNELDEAISHLQIVTSAPAVPFHFWHALATAYINRGSAVAEALDQALDACKATAPKEPDKQTALASVLIQSGRAEEGVAVLRRLIAAQPSYLPGFMELARHYMDAGQAAAEIEVLRAAMRALPGSEELHLQLARALEDQGDAEAAQRAYARARQINPRGTDSLAGLLKLGGAKAEDELIEEARSRLNHAATGDAEAATLAYALGKVLAARGEHQAAFESWSRANLARRNVTGPFDRQALLDRVDSLITGFTPLRLRQQRLWGSADPRPVFVVGVPRSGTTLVEQIIAAHPQCDGIGELAHIPMLAGQATAAVGRAIEPAALARGLTPALVQKLAQAYLATLDQRARQGATRVVDKLPTNFFHLGLIAAMFPQAHFIWCRRDPLDACLSMFSEDLAPSQRHATDLGDLGLYFRQHERLMEHWRSCGIAIHEVRYEALVGDLEAGSRALIAHLGLNWDAACLTYYARGGTVATPSRWQVRQPIYTSSVGRWRRYEPWLQPLMRALNA